MDSRRLITVKGVEVVQDDNGRVHWISAAAVDADGANGLTRENGKPLFAYTPADKGMDYLANAGYPAHPEDYKDILVLDRAGHPLEIDGGFISMTAYARKDHGLTLQERWLDAASVYYIVINPTVRQKARGVVLGCKARVTWRGRSVDAVVGDVSGPRGIGELSYALAKQLRFPNCSPRDGGIDAREVQFECWPDVPAVVDTEVFDLIRA